MHLTRAESNLRLPITRKGTKYLARASSHHEISVPTVIAVRDMLKLAKNAKEVRQMIKDKLLKINGKVVKDYRESVKLFNILEAGKKYELTILPTGKFTLAESKSSNLRLCKVLNKTLLSQGKIQLNLHDGTNIISKEKINVGDSVYLDFESKVKKHISLDKGSEVLVFSGKYAGSSGKISEISEGRVLIKFKEGEASLGKKQIVAI